MNIKKRNLIITLVCIVILIISCTLLFKNKNSTDLKPNTSNNSNNSSTKSKTSSYPLEVSSNFFTSIYKEDLDLFKSNVSETILTNIINHYKDNIKTADETITDDEILSKGIASANKYLKEKISETWIDNAKFDVYNQQDNVNSVEILFTNGQKLFFSVEDSDKGDSLISTSMGFTNYIYEMDLWFTLSNMN